jgi:hypothetical protein
MGVVLQVSAVRIDVVVHSRNPCPQVASPLVRGACSTSTVEHVFDVHGLPPEGCPSGFERLLDPAPSWLPSVDLVHPELLWGVSWLVEPFLPLHPAGPDGALRHLLEGGVRALERARGASAEIARLSAVVAGSLAAFARCRPSAVFDRQSGERGAMSAATRAARPAALTEVSEWAVDEVAVALRIPGRMAAGQLTESVLLAERLPCTLEMLARGVLSPAHARQMVNVVAPVADDVLRADIETHVLSLLGTKTPPQLGDCARRIVLRRDADAAAERLVAAVRERGVRLYERDDGMGTLAVDLPLPVCAAIYRALEAHAEQARVDGDQRTKQQRMADVLADVVLRPGEDGSPAVTIALTLVATLETMLGGAEPGQVEGMLVPAEQVRELGYTFGLMPRPAPELDGLPQPEPTSCPEPTPSPEPSSEPAPSRQPALSPESAASSPATPVKDRSLTEWMALVRARYAASVGRALPGARQAVLEGTWTDGEQRTVLDLGALMDVRDLAGTGLAHRPHIAIVDRLRGSLVALTDATAIRRGEALGPPPETDDYTPGAELDRFVRLRDRRCRFPGCRARARTSDLDHRREWPDGRTIHDNLCCLCEHHHRLKHQAPGWAFDEAPDGALAVTTPSGEVLTSHPPRFGTDLDIPPY